METEAEEAAGLPGRRGNPSPSRSSRRSQDTRSLRVSRTRAYSFLVLRGGGWTQRGWALTREQPSAHGSTVQRTPGIQGFNSSFPGGNAEAGELPRLGQGPRRGENGGLPALIQPTSPRPAICLMTPNRSGSSHQPSRGRLNPILLITKKWLVGEVGSGVPRGHLLPSLEVRTFLLRLAVGAQPARAAETLSQSESKSGPASEGGGPQHLPGAGSWGPDSRLKLGSLGGPEAAEGRGGPSSQSH